MRHVVVLDDLRETEIRPASLFERYVALSMSACRDLAATEGTFTAVACPACGDDRRRAAFDKWGLHYQECTRCATVYISPRPSQVQIQHFMQDSDAAEFRRSHLIRDTSANRSEKIVGPRVQWVASLIDESAPQPHAYADLFARYPMFVEGMARLGLPGPNFVVAPDRGLTKTCEALGIQTLADLPEHRGPHGFSAVTAWEIVNNAHAPRELVRSIWDALAPGGLLFLTLVNRDGFDVQVLWDRAPTILPLEHLNLFSIEGLQRMLEESGFRILELSTPGQLDVEIVRNALRNDATLEVPRFIRGLVERRGEAEGASFQEWLQRARLSSHTRVAAQKPI